MNSIIYNYFNYYYNIEMNEEELDKLNTEEWYKKCEKCGWYYEWEHKCDWLMAMLVAMGRANWKIIKFVDRTPKD